MSSTEMSSEVSSSGQPVSRAPKRRAADSATEDEPKRRSCDDIASVELFRKRLVSFTPGRWCAKPTELSPRVCAARGWRCVERDVMRCDACGALMNTPLPLLNSCSLSDYNALVDKYVALMQSAHKESCVWKDAIFREPEPETDPEKLKKTVLARTAVLERVLRKEFRVKKVREVTRDIPRRFGVAQSDALLMAICGWSYGDERDRISCTECLRSTFLFLFNDAKPFDPLGQHFQWCPLLDAGKYLPRWREDVNRAVGVEFQPDLGYSPVQARSQVPLGEQAERRRRTD